MKFITYHTSSFTEPVLTTLLYLTVFCCHGYRITGTGNGRDQIDLSRDPLLSLLPSAGGNTEIVVEKPVRPYKVRY